MCHSKLGLISFRDPAQPCYAALELHSRTYDPNFGHASRLPFGDLFRCVQRSLTKPWHMRLRLRLRVDEIKWLWTMLSASP
jgi:hypothetical protein